jgi:carboxymethylenebutenolidase
VVRDSGVEMRDKHRLRVRVQACELRREINTRLLPIGQAIDPIEQPHRLGVIAVRRMFREGIIEARIDQEVSEAGMAYPVNQHGEVARHMIAVGLRSQPMEPTKPKLPSEAIELYNLFIHGEISRRAFMDGVQRFAIGGLAAATIIEALMPNYALGQQVSKTDDRIKATYETVPSPQGNGSIKGYLVRPVSADTRAATAAKLPGIIVVHENRGLNPHIEDIARRLALANFMAFAPDGLTSLGGFPGDDYKGGQLFSKVDGKKMTEDFVASAMWLKSRADCTGKIGATGFCYGGGISNTLAVRLGADLAAAAPFYGAVPAKDDIPKIKAAILVHHGELDTRLAATWPAYDMALKAANVPHEGYIYPGAVHGFNCDATPERYNKAAADLAWQRTIDWFNKYVRV